MSSDHGIVRFLTCGSVDDGKSTLIGHLLSLTGNLYADQLQTLEQESRRIGTTADGLLDYSLLMDGLLAEREQGITIDVAYRYFSANNRKFIVADTPGHEQYTRNMATGASQCTAALILVDVTQGVLPQTRRHALICALLGIRHLLFVINKMDRIVWSQPGFDIVQAQCQQVVCDLASFGLVDIHADCIPVSALYGDNLTTSAATMPWYQGATVLNWLLQLPQEANSDQAPLRLPVQYVVKLAQESDQWQEDTAGVGRDKAGGTWRAYLGTIASGILKQGDQITILPAGNQTKIEKIYAGNAQVSQVSQGSAIAITLQGEFDVKRGDLICHPESRPEQSDLFKVRLVWMDEKALHAGRSYHCIGTWGSTTVEVLKIRNRIDLGSYQHLAANHLDCNDIGEVELHLALSIPYDSYQQNRETGSLILVDRLTNATAACGMIVHALRRADNVHWHMGQITPETRAYLKQQQPCVIWFTGLSGSGKSTIANALEKELVARGRHTMLLDGDNLRHGLNKDLGFTEADRVENIRRIGEVTKLMIDAGLIVITAFISPYRAEREMVRKLLPEGCFIEVYVSTPLEECEKRDVKGLYKKAREGKIPNFTGINAPYEKPEKPALAIDTSMCSQEQALEKILNLIS